MICVGSLKKHVQYILYLKSKYENITYSDEVPQRAWIADLGNLVGSDFLEAQKFTMPLLVGLFSLIKKADYCNHLLAKFGTPKSA